MPTFVVTLDGDPVNVGDTIYDMQYGPGQAAELLSGNRFILNFSPLNRRYTYLADTGCMNGRSFRTAFWQDPILATPVKNDSKWLAMKGVCQSVVASYRT